MGTIPAKVANCPPCGRQSQLNQAVSRDRRPFWPSVFAPWAAAPKLLKVGSHLKVPWTSDLYSWWPLANTCRGFAFLPIAT